MWFRSALVALLLSVASSASAGPIRSMFFDPPPEAGYVEGQFDCGSLAREECFFYTDRSGMTISGNFWIYDDVELFDSHENEAVFSLGGQPFDIVGLSIEWFRGDDDPDAFLQVGHLAFGPDIPHDLNFDMTDPRWRGLTQLRVQIWDSNGDINTFAIVSGVQFRAVPEPGVILLLAVGTVVLAARRFRLG